MQRVVPLTSLTSCRPNLAVVVWEKASTSNRLRPILLSNSSEVSPRISIWAPLSFGLVVIIT